MRSALFRFMSLALLLAPAGVFAQGGSPSGAPLNLTLIFMVSVAMVLVFGNMVLANVIRQLAEAVREKNRKQKEKTTVAAKILPVLLLLAVALPTGVWAQDAAAAAPSFWSDSTPISGIPRVQFLFLLGLIVLGVVLLLAQALIARSLIRELRDIPVKMPPAHLLFKKNVLDLFNKSVSVEKEETIMLEHDYDGIRELDNDLPPWWKYGFILTIIVAILYLGYYHMWGGPTQIEEYNTAVAKAEEEKAAYLAKSGEQIDENTVTMIIDKAQLADAKVLFNNSCAACHRPDGGGSVGPNLTDDYWLHGGAIKDVFKTIKYGVKDKGMPAWDGNLSPKQMAMVSSYVKSLHGTKPAGGKAPQGDLYVEGGDNAIDSVSNQTTPTLTPTGATENKNNPVGPYDNQNSREGLGEGTPPGKLK